jgi:hypothetical protein
VQKPLFAPDTFKGKVYIAEQALRQDQRLQKLLKNSNWKDAAEAAIVFFSRGVECSVESWPRSSTWQQVKVVFDELCVTST